MPAALHRLVRHLPPAVRDAVKSLPGVTAVRDRLYRRPQGDGPDPGSPRPVVYLPTWLEWDVMRQRPHYLLEALARAGHPVWFVDPSQKAVRTSSSGVMVSPSFRPVPARDVILYSHFALNARLGDHFENSTLIYDILDDLSIYDPDEIRLPENQKVRPHHRVVVGEASVVMVSNPVLYEGHKHERPDLLLIENGVDPAVFDPDGPATEIVSDSPVVGYHGAISEWFDFDLVRDVAEARPGLAFVIVGPTDERVAHKADELRRLPNVHLLPRQDVESVVGIIRGFDVGIIPFLVNDMTSGVTPLKMYEYMAMQVPCVSTALPAAVSHGSVAVAANVEEAVEAIDAVLAGDIDRQRLRNEAMAASWDRRIEPLLARLESDGLRFVPTP